jgi:hypothetical protein
MMMAEGGEERTMGKHDIDDDAMTAMCNVNRIAMMMQKVTTNPL